VGCGAIDFPPSPASPFPPSPFCLSKSEGYEKSLD
jgi:hypothetical protein